MSSGKGEWAGLWSSHAYSRKYSRFARLRLLGFKTPYFRNVNSKKDTQSFFESPLPTSRISFVMSLWLLIMLLLIRDQQGSQRKKQVLRPAFSLAPPAGLEPATSWLTVMRSTDWAKEEYLKGYLMYPYVSAMTYFSGPSPAKYFRHCKA